MRRDGNEDRKVEVKVAAARLFALGKCLIEGAEELHDPLLTTHFATGGVLDSEGVKGAVVSSNSEAPMTDIVAPHELDDRHEAFNTHKVGVLVAVLLVLTRNLDRLIELEEFEF